MTFVAEQFHQNGLTELVSVIPPGASLAPLSKIPLAAIGKCPGRRNRRGLWGGYDWQRHQTTLADVKQWTQDGANIGLRAARFPGVDIDCTDDALAGIIEQVAIARLGDAPVRTGRHPKRLLVYRTDAPFGRMRMMIYSGGDKHLIEILGAGQQYLVSGIHPATKLPYTWDRDVSEIRPELLTEITREQCNRFLAELETTLTLLDYIVERVGDGSGSSDTAAANQEELRATSIDDLERVVDLIPNDQWDYDRYVKIGYAIKAAAGDDEEAGYAVFASWAARWTEKPYDPDTTRSDWRRFQGPFKVGFSWLCEIARGHGLNDAAEVFTVAGDAPREDDETEAAPLYSDQWLADRVIDARGGELRFVPETGKSYVWSGYRWVEDNQLLTEAVIDRELRKIALPLVRTDGAAAGEQKSNLRLAQTLCSTQKASSVATQLRRNPAISLGAGKLDADPWLLNTPAGLVDLKTGALLGPDPDALCARSTSVAPDFSGDCPRWKDFLLFSTGANQELFDYLQRLTGYALTGSTREQHLTFIWGGGGNGKGVFINALTAIFGSYAKASAMDVFTARSQEQHPTELADLVGARLVTAQEAQEGKRWNEARVKSLTGGDEIKARFMRQDFFTFRPQFKLLFTGNDKPELRTVDDAMRRRMHLVTFPVKVPPEMKNPNLLSEVLAPEMPAILAWMIRGCLMWQEQGLNPPQIVIDTTNEYLEEEDEIGQWLQDHTEARPDAFTSATVLFREWEQWANGASATVHSQKWLGRVLQRRGYMRTRTARERGFRGIALIQRQDVGVIA